MHNVILVLSILVVILSALVCCLWMKLNDLTNIVDRLSNSFSEHLNNSLKFNENLGKSLDRVLQALNKKF